MTVLTARQVAGWWQAEGGPPSRDVEWTAIALGESGYDTAAVSPAGAIGLWQIMPFHAAEYGFQVSGLSDPQVNAYIAVRLSGYGVNCAAWDSAYRDIQHSGRYASLAWPEPGSADYANLPVVAAELGKDKTQPPATPMPASPGQNAGPALKVISEVEGRVLPALARTLAWERIQVDRMFTPGWRP